MNARKNHIEVSESVNVCGTAKEHAERVKFTRPVLICDNNQVAPNLDTYYQHPLYFVLANLSLSLFHLV